MSTFEDVLKAFGEMVKALRCPSCDIEYTDYAVNWGNAWSEGRRDALNDVGLEERDGPFKLKCEYCGHRAYLNYFTKTVKSTPDQAG